MKQLSKTQSIVYHLYPGVLITAGFILTSPRLTPYGYPPQFSMLLCIAIVAVPILLLHLRQVMKTEHLKSWSEINGLTNRIPKGRLMLYIGFLSATAFILWGITQTLDQSIAKKLFGWLPHWYLIQDFKGYPLVKIRLTLLLNLALNGIAAPLLEEYYFRGYLLPRMQTWGKYAWVINTVLFSLYHFWQPYVYITLIAALLPMNWLTYKTKDIRVSIFTHAFINLLGAILSFGLVR